jgi:hypothetical protein
VFWALLVVAQVALVVVAEEWPWVGYVLTDEVDCVVTVRQVD